MTTRPFLLMVILLVVLFAPMTHRANPITTSCNFTLSAVISAYELGQYAALQTGSDEHILSPDAAYVLAVGDALYSLKDDTVFTDLDTGLFSPDGRHLAIRGEGIYRVADGELIVPARAESIRFGDGAWGTGEIKFSPDGTFVAISGAGLYRTYADTSSTEGYGVFRLSDGQQIIATDSFSIEFSMDSVYVSTHEGVFRLSDVERIVATEDYTAEFSADGLYAFTRNGLFHLSDHVFLEAIFGEVVLTPDRQYAIVPFEGTFRLPDGERLYTLRHNSVYAHPPHVSSDSQYVIIPHDTLESTPTSNQTFVYRIADGTQLFAVEGLNAAFSPDSAFVALPDGVYRLADQQRVLALQDNMWRSFSRDSNYFATDEGVYRLNDGVRLINFSRPFASVEFSPDSRYVAVSREGVYRLSDLKQVLWVQEGYIGFTDDSDLITIWYPDPNGDYSFGLVRLSDGRHFQNVRVLSASCGILSVENNIVIIEAVQMP